MRADTSKSCVIYTITNNINNKIYVGYAKNFLKRKAVHLSSFNKGNHGNIHLQRAFNKYGEENFKFEILEECEEKYLCSQENYWCNLLNVHDRDYGYNIAPTRPGCNCSLSKETKLKISIALTGKRKSEQAKEHMSKVKKGVKVSLENIQKRLLKGYKRNHYEETKKKISIANKKPILQYDLKGNFIKEWSSATDVSIIDFGLVSFCCNQNKFNIKSTSGGYIWLFKEDIINLKIDTSKIYKRNTVICQYDLNESFIREWYSSWNIEKVLGYKNANITACCKGKKKQAYGFIWKYKED